MHFPDDDAPQPPTIIDRGVGASAPSVGAPPPAGQDNYVMGEEIARGGMGCIMEAADSKLKRTVAIKLMLFDANADADMHQRFLREAEVLALLAHPNIVPVYDIVWDEGVPLFYTMKRINGRTLQAILHDLRKEDAAALRDFTLDRLLLVFRKVCDALAFAHSKGVIHRDLKPENIMIGEFGEVLVMDWGLAKVVSGSEFRVLAARALPQGNPKPETRNPKPVFRPWPVPSWARRNTCRRSRRAGRSMRSTNARTFFLWAGFFMRFSRCGRRSKARHWRKFCRR